MKPTPLIAIAAAVAGFLAGWLAKPASPPAPAPAPITEAAPPSPPAHPPAQAPGVSETPPVAPVPAMPRPAPSRAAPQDDGSRDGAKMQRLAELLGLDEAAQTKLREILDGSAKAFTTADPTQPLSSKETLEVLAATAVGLEHALADLFTPEQAAKFAALRQRERANRIETKAQKELGRLCEITDLDAAQREQILPQLRQRYTAELEQMPAAYALWVESPVLPLGPRAMPEESILTLMQLAGSDATADPFAARQQMLDRQRQRLDEQLAMLRPLLTPAQIAQYETAAAQQRAIQDRMGQTPRP